MNKIQDYQIISNVLVAKKTYEMTLTGDFSWVKNCGQFINISIDNKFLKRPISICDFSENELVIIYKVVGYGTDFLANLKVGDSINCLIDLGNGYNLDLVNDKCLLIGGGVGVPPLYATCKKLVEKGVKVSVVLGFTSVSDMFYVDKFKELTSDVFVSTNDGTYGDKGFVTDVIVKNNLSGMDYLTCGPEVMLKGVHKLMTGHGQLSFEARMGCGFGACMGCSCKTVSGYKRICVEGPIMQSEDLLWND